MDAMPRNSLGADLVWWRTAAGMRTVVTVLWNDFRPYDDVVYLEARLFIAGRSEPLAWRMPLLPGQALILDSNAPGEWQGAAGQDGVLALYACTEREPSTVARDNFDRLYPFVDWVAPDGRVATLHSDQVVRRDGERVLTLTEIVVLESGDERNALVFLNGEHGQATGSLELCVENVDGERMSASYGEPMAPFSVNRITLATLFPDLVAFGGGDAIQVSGVFRCRGLFCRPYVETVGSRWGIYHGGDFYDWDRLPYPKHALVGGEVNPIAVRHDRDTRTIINLLHSHGRFDEDVAVDALLFNEEGACVAERRGWLQARRNKLARFDLAELLDDPGRPFAGHLALSFAARPGQDLPRRLQALLEMRRPDSVARTMAWSDEWNSRVRVAMRERQTAPPRQRAFFRVLADAERSTQLALTNAGHPGHDRDAQVRLRIQGDGDDSAEQVIRIAPFATCWVDLERLFPDLKAILTPGGVGVVVLESVSDIAGIGFTTLRRTGALAMEHFMAIASEHGGEVQWPSGH